MIRNIPLSYRDIGDSDEELLEELTEKIVPGTICKAYPAPIYQYKSYIAVAKVPSLDSNEDAGMPATPLLLRFGEKWVCIDVRDKSPANEYTKPTFSRRWVFMDETGNMFRFDFMSFKLFFSNMELL